MAIKIDKEQCIGCESCVATCPAGALSMEDGKASVNQDTCISCGACVGECPVGAISMEKAEKKEVANRRDSPKTYCRRCGCCLYRNRRRIR